MKRLVAVTAIGLLLGGAVLGAEKHGKNKHKTSKHAAVHADGATVDVHLSWGVREIEVVRTHYAPRYRHLPPGLAKKYARTGQLPPGWQKKMEPLPVVIERELVPLPAGYRRGVFEGHAVIYNSSGMIIDVAVLF